MKIKCIDLSFICPLRGLQWKIRYTITYEYNVLNINRISACSGHKSAQDAKSWDDREKSHNMAQSLVNEGKEKLVVCSKVL